MRVAVTGANGHLGSTLYRHLLEKGIDTIACARRPLPFAAKQADCDLRDMNALAKSFDGCKVVFHSAAPTQLWSHDKRDIEDPIYEGTLNVIRACAKAKVEKVIYTSTCAAVGFHAKTEALNEDDYNHNARHPQFRAKLRSELDGALLAEKLGVRFVSVCVPSIVGPGFARATPSVEPYVQLARGKLPFVPDLSYSIVDVRDLAQAQILLALNAPKNDRYIVASHFVSTQVLLQTIKDIDKTLRVPSVLPSFALPLLALVDAAAHLATFKKTQRKLTFDLVRECRKADQRLNTSRFRNEFQMWSPRSLSKTIHDTIAYIRSEYAQ